MLASASSGLTAAHVLSSSQIIKMYRTGPPGRFGLPVRRMRSPRIDRRCRDSSAYGRPAVHGHGVATVHERLTVPRGEALDELEPCRCRLGVVLVDRVTGAEREP